LNFEGDVASDLACQRLGLWGMTGQLERGMDYIQFQADHWLWTTGPVTVEIDRNKL
jgi:isocitrate dehydrogenase